MLDAGSGARKAPGHVIAALALAALTTAATPAEVPNPRTQNAWVSDMANMIPPEAEGRMNNVIARLERDLRAEIAVVTVDDTDRPPKEFAADVFVLWGIGKSDADNGLIILMVKNQRRLEMETGYGLEPVLGDGWLGLMQTEVMVPAFKAGDYAKGLEAGLSRVDAELRANAGVVREGTRRTGVPAKSESESLIRIHKKAHYSVPVVPILMLFGMIGLPIVFVFAFMVSRRRERTCDRCTKEMHLLDEAADDAHLTEGQQKEEQLGSMNYLVYICDPCENMRIIPRHKWFSGQSKCSRCTFKTLQSRSVTLQAANYVLGGTVQITETCGHCHHRNVYTRSTPRLQRSTTTSSGGSRSSSGGSRSSGGGSFGGGRSGGGGAGSSW